ncbi:MAG: NAD(P)H-hydrate dehydratase [Candidatus Hodarchaeales archaeon]|jgi:NAD(P)H-hydrate epimerase
MNNNEISSDEMSIYDVNSEWYGVPRYILMENAGAGIANYIRNFLTNEENKRFESIVIFCGTGGNGGDGMVIARHLYDSFDVTVYLLGDPGRISSPPAKKNWKTLQKLPNLEKMVIRDSKDIDKIPWKNYDIIIDAILGAGLKSTPRNPHAILIEKINENRDDTRKIWSLDLPSGLLTNGKPSPVIIDADLIFSLHKPKLGTLKLAETLVIPIGVPNDAVIGSGPGYLQSLRPHSDLSHKGENGTVLLIGGSKSYHGATILSGLSILKTNIDLLTIACPEEISTVIRQGSPEFIVFPYKFSYLNQESIPELITLAEKNNVVLIGPGLGNTPEVGEAVELFINKWSKLKSKPGLVIDADALKFIKPVLSKLKANVIVTPHAGEYEMITGEKLETPNNLKMRISQVEKCSKKYSLTWLVKGKVDLIAQKGRVIQNHTGCPAMTIGGTGDVLAGVTTGLYSRLGNTFNASVAGAFWTGLTGEYIDSKKIDFSTSKLIENLPYIFDQVKKFIAEDENEFQKW